MLIRKRRGWELPERVATSEAVFHDRRRLLKALAAGPILAAGLGNLYGPGDRTRAEEILLSLALCRRPDDGRGQERPRVPRHRDVRQAGAEAGRRAVAARRAVEIWVQIGEVDRPFRIHRQAPEI